ncbi:MAG: universal stress protein [Candidatus Rokuibacteriota bacterium]
MTRPIMYATDFSPASRAAFAKAVEFAKQNRAPLTITHVT